MTSAVPTPSRRSVAKGAAWAVPSAAIAVAAPAYAASAQYNYYAWWSMYSYISCYNGDLSLTFNSNTNFGEGSPYGFNVYNDKDSNGNTSPSTEITITKLSVTYVIPKWVIDPNHAGNPFYGDWGDWALAGAPTTTYYGDGTPAWRYTFAWNGTRTGTSIDYDGGSNEGGASWPGSVFSFDVATSSDYCDPYGLPKAYYGGFTIEGTAANGGTVTNPDPVEWIRFEGV